MEASVSKGKKVAEKDVMNLIEQLMVQLIKLDGVVADGDIKLQRGMQVCVLKRISVFRPAMMSGFNRYSVRVIALYCVVIWFQVRRVQKYVETLDVLKIKNARITTSILSQQQQQQHQKRQQPPPSSVVVTTEWEMFDSLFGPSTSTPTSTSAASSATAPRSDWQLV